MQVVLKYAFPKFIAIDPQADILRLNTLNTNHDKHKLALQMAHQALYYNYATCKTNLAIYLIHSEHPFSIAEGEVLTEYIRTHNPNYEPISRNTIRTEMFRVVEKQNQMLIAILSSLPHKVAPTSDCWKTFNGNHYIVITAHYIDFD